MQQLLNILKTVDRPGNIYASGQLDACYLGLHINTIGRIALPLIEHQAQQIIQCCEQAPYGLGEDTLLDTSVRKVWQLDPSHLQINNPQWHDVMLGIIKRTKSQLGLAASNVSFELYKLLIYEAGCFFSPHRDTEKTHNMFATLIIVLPSSHQGGALVIRHHGIEESFSFDAKEAEYYLHFVAFYADCQHEVEVVRQGYRLCLVYNLILEQAERQPLAPNFSGQANQIQAVLQDHFQQKPLDKQAICLNHQYSRAGLSIATLKNADRSIVDVLMQAAKRANCVASLCVITHWQSGEADYNYNGYDDREDECEMEEVYESALYLSHWLSPDDTILDYGDIGITEDQIVSTIEFENWLVSSQTVHEATGNEGVSLERWYRQVAVVIWSKQQHYYHLCQGKAQYVLPLLVAQVKQYGQNKNTQDYQDCCVFAEMLIQHWHGLRDFHDNCQLLLKALWQLNNLSLIKSYMLLVLTKGLSPKLGKLLFKVCEQHGWDKLQASLTGLLACYSDAIHVFLPIFVDLCTLPSKHHQQRLLVCRALAPQILLAVKSEQCKFSYSNKRMIEQPRDLITFYQESILNLFTAFTNLNKQQLLIDFVTFVMQSKQYDIVEHIAPSILQLSHVDGMADYPAFQTILKYCQESLQHDTNTDIEKPSDWAQAVRLTCICQECKILQKFIYSPVENVCRFKVNKSIRQHLHNQISRHNCDMTHVTERKGSPQTLVCSKTRNRYMEAKQLWLRKQELLSGLIQI